MKDNTEKWGVSPDTTPDAHRKQIEILRRMPPQRRALKSFEISDNVRQNVMAGIARMHPDFSDAQIANELLRRMVGDELFQRIVAAKGLK
jgi:hypothetical protein